jgi:predicted KAP-like P-loop ATPase
MPKSQQRDTPAIDSPIISSSQDALSRSPVAFEFALTIRELNAAEGLVVGVLGAWGYGKSSFINLMREQFESVPKLTVVDFNPWMFSGSRQLVDFFFTEIAAELKVSDKKRFAIIADWLNEYAGVLTPLASIVPIPGLGVAVDGAQKLISGLAASTDADRSTRQLRDKLRSALAGLDQPIVVVVDDIDRLTSVEIREIFKLVRLTASFPNVIYILAFDRERVERALDEDGIPGRAYLEKIVQLSFDVPQIPNRLLRSNALEELDRVLGAVESDQLDQSRWAEAFFGVIEPLLHNIRDVTRYALSARSTIRGLTGHVDLVDVLTLEAIRVFRPELFRELTLMRVALTPSVGFSVRDQSDVAQKQFDGLAKTFVDDGELVVNLIRTLFPAGRRFIDNQNYGSASVSSWRKSHRVAHFDYFSLYLDRFAPEELDAFRVAEKAQFLLEDAGALSAYLRSIDPKQLEGVLEGLESYESTFTFESVVPATSTLLNLIDVIPDRPNRGMFDIGRPEISVSRVVLRMLTKVDDEEQRESLATEVIRKVETYSSQLDFVHFLGYTEGVGHKLVSEEFAARIEQEIEDRFTLNRPAQPDREWGAVRVYYFLSQRGVKAPLNAVQDPALIRAVLRSSKSAIRSQGMDSSAIRSEDTLDWETLVKLFGTEGELRTAIAMLRAADATDPILPLADRYLGGWRPTHF